MDTDLLRADLAAVYPQFGLRVAHAGVVLAPPTDVELFELAPIVAEPGGILGPEQAEFVTCRALRRIKLSSERTVS